MKLEIISKTADMERLIVTSVLTTTSGKKPSRLFNELETNPNKVKKILRKLEVQHGSVLDHNILCMHLYGRESEVLDILLKSSYFSITKIENDEWIISSNLRTIIRYIQNYDDEFSRKLYDIVKTVTPNINLNVARRTL